MSHRQSLYHHYFNTVSGYNVQGFKKKAKDDNYTGKQIKSFLNKLDNQQKFIQRKTIPRYPILNTKKNQSWEIDLIDFSKPQYTVANGKWKYILVIIDQATRFVWTRPLVTKTPEATLEVFKDIVGDTTSKPIEKKPQSKLPSHFQKALSSSLVINKNEGSVSPNVTKIKPKFLLSDWGSEWKGVFEEYLERLGIRHVTEYSVWYHCPFVERVIQTLKRMLGKYFETNNTTKWYRVIEDITTNYNTKIHSALQDTPSHVYHHPAAFEEAVKFMKHNYEIKVKKVRKEQAKLPKLHPGDKVRMKKYMEEGNKDPKAFKKGYETKWSDKIFTVEGNANIGNTVIASPQYFQLVDQRGLFFRGDLLKVHKDAITFKKPIQTTKQYAKQQKEAKRIAKDQKDGIVSSEVNLDAPRPKRNIEEKDYQALNTGEYTESEASASEEEESDEGASDEATSEAEESDEGASDQGASEASASEEEKSDQGASEASASEEEESDEGASDQGASEAEKVEPIKPKSKKSSSTIKASTSVRKSGRKRTQRQFADYVTY
jgi:hypothetical protein